MRKGTTRLPERIVKNTGYVYVHRPDHPRALPGGRVPEQVLVMEHHIGRFLFDNEVPHHKNLIRTDNRIENLQLMTETEHKQLHAKLQGFGTKIRAFNRHPWSQEARRRQSEKMKIIKGGK